MGHESGISLFASGNLFEQSYNPKVIHTYREGQQATRVVGFAKGNPLSRESLKTLKQHIPAAHLPHRGKSFDVCTELVERRLSKERRKRERKGEKWRRRERREIVTREGVGLGHQGFLPVWKEAVVFTRRATLRSFSYPPRLHQQNAETPFCCL